MTTDRVFYSDANGVSIGTRELAFGERKYAPRNVRGCVVATQARRAWPGYIAMLAGAGLLGYAFISIDYSIAILGVATVLGGSFYMRRRRPLYALRLLTVRQPVLVLVSRDKLFLEGIKASVDRVLEIVHTSQMPPPSDAPKGEGG